MEIETGELMIELAPAYPYDPELLRRTIVDDAGFGIDGDLRPVWE